MLIIGKVARENTSIFIPTMPALRATYKYYYECTGTKTDALLFNSKRSVHHTRTRYCCIKNVFPRDDSPYPDLLVSHWEYPLGEKIGGNREAAGHSSSCEKADDRVGISNAMSH
jgi:hypothetical protein